MRLFITGTDTEVGKTAVTACLAAALRDEGVVAAKPVASGVEPGTAGEDAEHLARAAGHPPCVHATFTTPVSPHRAAMIEGRSLDDQALLAWVRDLSGPHVLVEGVGGWCVPVTEELWVRDLAAATAAPVLVVAADRLGVLNHTLLTVRAVRDDGFEVVGVVLNQGVNVAPDDVSTQSNADDLRQLLDVPVVVLGRVSADNEADAGRALLEALPVIRSTANSGEA